MHKRGPERRQKVMKARQSTVATRNSFTCRYEEIYEKDEDWRGIPVKKQINLGMSLGKLTDALIPKDTA